MNYTGWTDGVVQRVARPTTKVILGGRWVRLDRCNRTQAFALGWVEFQKERPEPGYRVVSYGEPVLGDDLIKRYPIVEQVEEEPVYTAAPIVPDITIGQAERLYDAATSGEVASAVLIEMYDL